MQQSDIIQYILKGSHKGKLRQSATAFAPTNIALCKYWGKRSAALNTPDASSLSVALPDKGVITTLRVNNKQHHQIWLNGKRLNAEDKFVLRLTAFLTLFGAHIPSFLDIETVINIPVSAGLASSACGFAALVLALNDLFDWQLSEKDLSILARMGSGSASRSLWPGFVVWEAGKAEDGMDSYATPLAYTWPALRIGLLVLDAGEKVMGSRQAMAVSKETSPRWSEWIKRCNEDFKTIQKAIENKDFYLLGSTAETNALAMHATARSSTPSIEYSTEMTRAIIQKIGNARKKGLDLFFTQDAGPNIKLLFLDKDTEAVKKLFPDVDIIAPFLDRKFENDVILVNEKDRAYGHCPKLAAHEQALCHRAISVFIFRYREGQLETLLQQRSPRKIHSSALWTNTCCSHPRLGENVFSAAHRRLREEMGMSCQLLPRGVFHYIAPFGNGLSEHEVDHVFIGFDEGGGIHPDFNEIEQYKWVSIDALHNELHTYPQRFTAWFAQALDIALGEHYQNQLR